MTTSTQNIPSEPPLTSEIRPLLKLAWPLIGNNLALSGMSFADAVMAGRLGGRDLAAVAVGNSTWVLFFLAALGLLMAVSPLVSQCYGAGRYDRIGAYLRDALKIAVVAAAAILLVLQLGTGFVMDTIGIDSAFKSDAIGYVEAITWGAPAICCYLAIRFALEGIGYTRPMFYVSMMALVVNVLGNWVFMYGKWGAPALGGVGCGVASAIAMWFMFIALLIFVYFSKRCEVLRLFKRHKSRVPHMKREILALGIPISANVVAEVGLFVAVSLLMGTLSANAAAAHQIALNYASTMFMIPMALASALSIRVGHAIGAGDPVAARRRGSAGIWLCGFFMTLSATMLLIFKDQIVGLYTNDPAVTRLAVSLLFVAAIFQISDGVQVGAAGALRGLKDARVPLAINIFAYWVVGFTLAYGAANGIAPSPRTIWMGFVFGLSVAAVLLTMRWWLLTRRLTEVRR